MLSSEYRHTLDGKNRLFIPAKLREDLGTTLVISKDIRENCLKVYSLSGWGEYIAPIKKLERKISERILRYLHASQMQATPDSQGRVVLLQELVDFAQLEKNVVIVGCGEYAEIWSESNYEKLKSDEDLDQLRAELEKLGL